MSAPTYHVADALDWLQQPQNMKHGAIITGPPDPAEIGMDPHDYPAWLDQVLTLSLRATKGGTPCTFIVTDRKADGGTISKAHAAMTLAHDHGMRLLWHKVVLRRDPGKVDLHRPGYSHLLAFGDDRVRPGTATPDVIPTGQRLYANGTDTRAATVAIRHALLHTTHITDPFCGRGTIPALAAAMGATAVGVDIDPAQVERARALQVRPRA